MQQVTRWYAISYRLLHSHQRMQIPGLWKCLWLSLIRTNLIFRCYYGLLRRSPYSMVHYIIQLATKNKSPSLRYARKQKVAFDTNRLSMIDNFKSDIATVPEWTIHIQKRLLLLKVESTVHRLLLVRCKILRKLSILTLKMDTACSSETLVKQPEQYTVQQSTRPQNL